MRNRARTLADLVLTTAIMPAIVSTPVSPVPSIPVQATSTIDAPTTAPAALPPSRSFRRAFADLRDAAKARELWAHLGWQDIKQRYRRSVLGPIWITISMGVTAVGLGTLYGVLFNSDIKTYLPYVTTGFIVWNFINGCLVEGMETFISNEGLIKHLPAPLSVYAFRTIWRQTLMLAHNMIIYVIILVIFFRYLDKPNYTTSGYACGAPQAPHAVCHPGLSLFALTGLLGFALLALNALWLTLLFGIISTRFRDLPQLINALIMLAFYVTPIVWSPDTLFADPSRHWAELVFKLNPLYHFVQIVRAPLIGQVISPSSWLVVGAITVLGWTLALVAMRKYRPRVSYWV